VEKYADGAVEKNGRIWKDIELDKTFLMAVPYKMDEK
jgi:hypothetical protein